MIDINGEQVNIKVFIIYILRIHQINQVISNNTNLQVFAKLKNNHLEL